MTLPIPLYAGLDWSGSPHPKQTGMEMDLYVPGGIVVPDVEAVDAYLADLRRRWSRPATFEFHGHELTEAELLHIMEYVFDEVQVVAILLDKAGLAQDLGAGIFSRPLTLIIAAARPVVSRMLESSPLRKLWYDRGDVPAASQQKAFRTAIQREARALRPGTHIDVKPSLSEKSSLVQMADMAIYALQREVRGSFEKAELRAIVRALWCRDGNEIWWGSGNDLRPYL